MVSLRNSNKSVCVSAVLGLDLGKASGKVHFQMVNMVWFGLSRSEHLWKMRSENVHETVAGARFAVQNGQTN